MKQPAASMDRPINAFRSAVALLDKCLDAAALLARSHDQRHGCGFTADHVTSLATALFRRATQDRYQTSREDIVKALAFPGSLPDARKRHGPVRNPEGIEGVRISGERRESLLDSVRRPPPSVHPLVRHGPNPTHPKPWPSP